MDILFLNRVPGNREAYADKLVSVSNRLGTDPNWLQFVFDWEDASTFRPSHENSFGCVGYIQFCADESGGEYKTIDGTTYLMSDIKAMTDLEQLELVYDYLKPYKGDFDTYHNLYFAVLYPAAIGKPDDYVLNTRTNSIFDLNRNGTITVGEVKRYMDNRVAQVVPKQYQDSFKKKEIFCKSVKERLSLASC